MSPWFSILCTNRDEFLDRPTQDAHFHSFEDGLTDNSDNILSGRDIQAGGSWFGINRAGRVALLTNITEAATKQNTSRGYLVSSFLLSDSSHPLKDEVGQIIPQDAKFAGFNLLLFAPRPTPDKSIQYDNLLVTNHGSGGMITSRPLSREECSCGCLSNGIDGVDASEWPKAKKATRDLDTLLNSVTSDTTETEIMDRLFELLAWVQPMIDSSLAIFLTFRGLPPKSWRTPEPITQRSQIRKTVQVAPVPIILDGAPDVTPRIYGTRLATVLLVKKDGEVLFVERDIWKLVDGRAVKEESPTERSFRFHLQM